MVSVEFHNHYVKRSTKNRQPNMADDIKTVLPCRQAAYHPQGTYLTS